MSISMFARLPLELKELVWRHSMPEPIPEVALLPAGLRPIIPLGPRPDDSAANCLIIYTAYPVLMHVCREWRAFARARTTFHYSQVAMMDVPSRAFQPELDILYIPALDSNPIWFCGDARCPVTRHVAMQSQTFLNYGARSLALMTYFQNMETLTIVLPSPTGRYSLHSTFAAPTRRCRLRRIGEEALNDLDVLSVVQERCQAQGAATSTTAESPGQGARVSAFLQWVEVVAQRTKQYLRATQEWDPDLQEEREQDRGVHALRFEALAQTFVEYEYKNGSSQWVDSQQRR